MNPCCSKGNITALTSIIVSHWKASTESICNYWLYFLYQGIENSWKRHNDTIEHLWAGIEKMGLEMFVKDKVNFSFNFYPMKCTSVKNSVFSIANDYILRCLLKIILDSYLFLYIWSHRYHVSTEIETISFLVIIVLDLWICIVNLK